MLCKIRGLRITLDVEYSYSMVSYWGLAAYYTYRAYKEDFLLSIATSQWDLVSTYFVTEAQAANGSHPTRNVTIASQCNGCKSMPSPDNVAKALTYIP